MGPAGVFFHMYETNRLKQYPLSSTAPFSETRLFVVFDGETQRQFSSVRIVLFCDPSCADDVQYACAIQQLEPITDDNFSDHLHQNLAQLTVAFRVIPEPDFKYVRVCRISLSAADKLHHRNGKSVCSVLLDTRRAVTPGTPSVIVDFKHLCPPIDSRFLSPNHYVANRIVRVVPVDVARSRTTISCLPLELLVKIFEASDSLGWQRNLLSYARVCHQWSQCSMKVITTYLESPEWRRYCLQPEGYLDILEFAKAFQKTPSLGLYLQHLDIDYYVSWLECDFSNQRRFQLSGFFQALTTILRATKNMQRLRLSLGYSLKTTLFLSAIPKLHLLHTLSITTTQCNQLVNSFWKYSISTSQLTRFMARWSALTSLTVEYMKPGNIGMRRLFLTPPTCTLTQLCIRHSTISDKDLLYLTASSTNTLTEVTLEDVSGITNDGLRAFFESMSQNVVSLTIRGIEPKSSCRNEDPALDDAVDKMRCLQTLNICGDVASARMIHRRSEMFAKGCGSDVPVVRLWSEFVPGVLQCADQEGQEWVGWEVVELC